MATIFYGFTIEGGTGTQTVELIRASTNEVISTTTANASNGVPFTGNWVDNTLDCVLSANVRIRVTSGSYSSVSSEFNMNCPCPGRFWSVQSGTGGTVSYRDSSDSPQNLSLDGSEPDQQICVLFGTTPTTTGDVDVFNTGVGCNG